MAKTPKSPLASLPAVGQLLESLKNVASPVSCADPKLLAHLSRQVLDDVRDSMRCELKKGHEVTMPTVPHILDAIVAAYSAWGSSSTCRVINGSGIVLHSGLGRAVYPQEARQQLTDAEGYVLLEVDKQNGKRRRRDQFCADLICELTGAEAATVVNNNAAATLIILNELGFGKEMVVSRSQMIEIGGSFRLPDVFEAAGCKLIEVGTTNKSRISDYAEAITDNTGALVLVHTSNYRIVGFTDHVDLPELVELGRERQLPVIHDLGSGSLVDLARYGVHDEPAVQVSVKQGADVICFSGDKLVGGPQAGIIIGKKKWIDRIRKNPLARALRIDKTACLALEATLKLFFEPSKLEQTVPTLRMLSESVESVGVRAHELAEVISSLKIPGLVCRIIESTSELGAGTLPTHGIPTICLTLEFAGMRAQETADRLRGRPVAIFSRLKDDQVQLDLRTMTRADFDEVSQALKELQRD